MSHTLVLNTDHRPVGFLPLSALSWQDSIRALYLGTVTSLHNYENWWVQSPSQRIAVPSVVVTTRYIKIKRNSIAFNDTMVFLRDEYRCQYCGKLFSEHQLTLDHVTPRSMGGNRSWTNIVSACSPCNSRRGNNVRQRPLKEPRRPNYWQMVELRRQHPLIIPDESWMPYLDWADRVEIIPPYGMPGYKAAPTKMLRTLVG